MKDNLLVVALMFFVVAGLVCGGILVYRTNLIIDDRAVFEAGYGTIVDSNARILIYEDSDGNKHAVIWADGEAYSLEELE